MVYGAVGDIAAPAAPLAGLLPAHHARPHLERLEHHFFRAQMFWAAGVVGRVCERIEIAAFSLQLQDGQ